MEIEAATLIDPAASRHPSTRNAEINSMKRWSRTSSEPNRTGALPATVTPELEPITPNPTHHAEPEPVTPNRTFRIRYGYPGTGSVVTLPIHRRCLDGDMEAATGFDIERRTIFAPGQGLLVNATPMPLHAPVSAMGRNLVAESDHRAVRPREFSFGISSVADV